MKIKRFDIFEAKSQKTKILEEKIIKFIINELNENKLQRFDIIKKIEKKFKEISNISKISRNITNKIISDPLKSKENIKIKKENGKVLYYIDNIMKKNEKKKEKLKFGSPEWREKYIKHNKKNKNNKSKIDRFDDFKINNDAKKLAEKDMNNIKIGKRNINFAKDSTKQLRMKLKSDKYKNYRFDIQDELNKRNN